MRLQLAALAMAALLAGPALAAGPGVTDTELRLGGSTALTGPGTLVGVGQDLGEKVAAMEINAAGGINGRRIVRFMEDDGYVPTRTVQAVRRLLDVHQVLAVSATSGAASTMAALPLLEAQGVPEVMTAAPNTVMVEPMHRGLFVIGKTYGAATYEMVKFLAARKPGAKFVAVVQDDDFGDGVQAGYEQALKELKIASLGVMRYRRGQVDFSAEMLKAKQLGADTLVSGGIIGENVAMAKEARRLDYGLQIAVLSPARLPQIIELMGEAGNGIIAADYIGDFTDAAGRKFMEAARKHLTADEVSKLNRYSLLGYVGYQVLFDAIRRCGKDVSRACVTDKLETTTALDMGGMTSPISFTPKTRLSDLAPVYFTLDWAKKDWVPLAR